MEIKKLKDIRLLLVDDDPNYRSILTKRLQRKGLNALQACDGTECLNMLEKNSMHVVVIDVKMPGMTGIDVLHIIKKAYPKTEVILLTGHAAAQDGVEGIKSGAFDYLTKPVEFEHLLGKIIQAYEKIQNEKEKQEASEYKAKLEQQMIATERLAALGTLAAGVAHEINNPLAIINEAAGYMISVMNKEELAKMPYKETFIKALEKIENSVKRARSITHQLLGSVQKSDSILQEVDLCELVVETTQLFRKELMDKNISMEVNRTHNLKSIWVDANRVRQILINLISNGIHATYKDGSISIQVDNIDEGVSISVSDTGTGIPKENLDKIFEPFFSTKAPGEGTGLGLFVITEIIEKLGGTIDVKSQVGHGTEFTVQLPDQGKISQIT